MFCYKCGTQLPNDARFCYKCGAQIDSQTQQGGNAAPAAAAPSAAATDAAQIAGPQVSEIKCPGCGAPIKPQFGEMVVTCEYCGSSITLSNAGWKGVDKHTMLPLKYATKEAALSLIRDTIDRGLLRKHLEEESVNEELTLSVVPYWIVPVSARTSYTAVDAAAEVGSIATTAALFGLMGGAFGGGRNSGFGTGMMEGAMFGGMAMGGFGGGRNNTIRSYSLDQDYQFPVIAMKALAEYQPKDYAFALQQRLAFTTSSIPKFTRILNGDVGEDSAKNSAKTNVDQLQSAKAHKQHHMVQKINTQTDVSDPELMHVPVWFARFDHKGKKIIVVLDANSGGVINSIGLD